jgi:gas vesicle protein
MIPLISRTYLTLVEMELFRLRSRRQYSSQYLPVAPIPSSAVTSRDSSRDNAKRSKEQRSRNSDTFPNPKRRSTMNSRDAAYDEEEQIRRAIEESKEDNQGDGEEGSRRSKRSRSDSEAHVMHPSTANFF